MTAPTAVQRPTSGPITRENHNGGQAPPENAAAAGVGTSGGTDLVGDQTCFNSNARRDNRTAADTLLPPAPSLSAEAVAVLAQLTTAQIQRKIRLEQARYRVCAIVRNLGVRLTELADECQDADANMGELRLLFVEAAEHIRSVVGDA